MSGCRPSDDQDLYSLIETIISVDLERVPDIARSKTCSIYNMN